MLRCAVVVLSFVTDTPCVYQISHEKSRLEFVAKVAFADIGEIISKVVLMAFDFRANCDHDGGHQGSKGSE